MATSDFADAASEILDLPLTSSMGASSDIFELYYILPHHSMGF